jgi:hypothetical protein
MNSISSQPPIGALNSVDPAKVQVRSNWSTLPSEVRDRILDVSDSLTQYLNKHGKFYNSYLKSRMVGAKKTRWMYMQGLEIWKVAFNLDWPGDLRSLPLDFLRPPPYVGSSDFFSDAATSIIVWDVKSRSMWKRLRDMLFASEFISQFKTEIEHTLAGTTIRRMWPELAIEVGIPLDDLSKSRKVAIRYALLGYILRLESHGGQRITRYDYDEIVCQAAILGKLDIVQYVCANGPRSPFILAAFKAASNGYIDVVKCLIEHYEAAGWGRQDVKLYSHLFFGAAIYGHIDVLRFLHPHLTGPVEQLVINVEKILEYAVWRGHSEVVQFMHEHYGPFPQADGAQ